MKKICVSAFAVATFSLAACTRSETVSVQEEQTSEKISLLVAKDWAELQSIGKQLEPFVRSYTIPRAIRSSDPEGRKYLQNFFVNSYYASKKDAPVLFMIRGYNADKTYLTWEYAQKAEKLGAHLVVLEHRYFGKSLPEDGSKVTLDDMMSFSLADSLEDAHAAQRFLVEKEDMNGPWITYGVSQDAFYAAAYRAKYPAETAGAYVSSTLLNLKPKTLSYESAKKALSSECQSNFRMASSFLVDNALSNPDFGAKITDAFSVPEGRLTPLLLREIIVSSQASVIQYEGVGTLCDALARATTDEEKALSLANIIKSTYTKTRSTNSVLGDTVETIRSHDFSSKGQLWSFRQCSFYPFLTPVIPEGDKSLIPFDWNIDTWGKRCSEALGRDMVSVQKQAFVDAKNTLAPLYDGTVGNVVFVINGKDMRYVVDPSTLPHLESKNQFVFVNPEGDHGSDTDPPFILSGIAGALEVAEAAHAKLASFANATK